MLASFVVVEHIVVCFAPAVAANTGSQPAAVAALAGRQADVETAPVSGPARQSAEAVAATVCFDTCSGPSGWVLSLD